MKRFKVEVTRIDEYIIEVDESVYNKEWSKEFRRHFYNFDCPEDIAEHLSQLQARFGSTDGFIEGFGYVLRDRELPFSTADFDKNGQWLPEEQRRKAAPGLNIQIVDEDNELSMDVTELDN